MLTTDIIRAWKDEAYRDSLNEEQISQVPENPAGLIELCDIKMTNIKDVSCNSNTQARISSTCAMLLESYV
ncbi:mersacidin/lichenicidin family type 2 lantibiotic [Nostoc sp. C117]|uniref:mersacidin/lichenicidin family type 2 lantibiotic n=1 Tax=Nostoc sp. C117 TaxID=3349875 RepID=UPI00370D9D8A